jgi:hypothetical protein
MWWHVVGRRSRRAEDESNILSLIAPDLSRAHPGPHHILARNESLARGGPTPDLLAPGFWLLTPVF